MYIHTHVRVRVLDFFIFGAEQELRVTRLYDFSRMYTPAHLVIWDFQYFSVVHAYDGLGLDLFRNLHGSIVSGYNNW